MVFYRLVACNARIVAGHHAHTPWINCRNYVYEVPWYLTPCFGMCTGVVDLLVEDIEARVLAVGEVKPEATAECQVLAPLLLQKEKHGVCPVGKFVM